MSKCLIRLAPGISIKQRAWSLAKTLAPKPFPLVISQTALGHTSQSELLLVADGELTFVRSEADSFHFLSA